jgi:hypothetical protein
MIRLAVSGFVTSALVASNTILVSRLSPQAVGVSFAISLCWAYAVGNVAKADTYGRVTYAAAAAAGCGAALWIA